MYNTIPEHADFLRRQAKDLRENGCPEAMARADELEEEAHKMAPLQLAPAPVVKEFHGGRGKAPRVRASRAKIKPTPKGKK